MAAYFVTAESNPNLSYTTSVDVPDRKETWGQPLNVREKLISALQVAAVGTNTSPEYQRDAEYLLDGNFIIRRGHVPRTWTYEPELRFEPETIDWTAKYGHLEYMVQHYLQSLEPVRLLLIAHLQMPNPDAVALARRISLSWIDFAASENAARSSLTWYDHCVSERSLLFPLILMLDEQGDPEDLAKIEQSLIQHGEFLMDDANYVPMNHGTIADRSLYLVARFLEDRNRTERATAWRERALERLTEAFHRDFSANMVNLENSSSYHDFTLDLFMGIERLVLGPFGDSLSDDARDRFSRAIDFLVYASQPDGTLPFFGDGAKLRLQKLPERPNFVLVEDNPRIAYVVSGGVRGTAPGELVKAYTDEGYVFMRSSWVNDPESPPSYAMFKAGYMLRPHKHADDTSFTWYTKGKEVFVDSGVYTYEWNDYRRYFTTARAHNLVLVDGKSWNYETEDMANVGIIRRAETSDYTSITARNDMFEDAWITRTFVYAGSISALVIVDEVASERSHTYSQLFHLSHHLGAVTVDQRDEGDLRRYDIGTEALSVTIRQAVATELVRHDGDLEKPGYGLVSERFNDLHTSTTLEFKQAGVGSTYVTVISTVEDQDDACSIAVSTDRVDVVIRGLDLTIPLGDSAMRMPPPKPIETAEVLLEAATPPVPGPAHPTDWRRPIVHKLGTVLGRYRSGHIVITLLRPSVAVARRMRRRILARTATDPGSVLSIEARQGGAQARPQLNDDRPDRA